MHADEDDSPIPPSPPAKKKKTASAPPPLPQMPDLSEDEAESADIEEVQPEQSKLVQSSTQFLLIIPVLVLGASFWCELHETNAFAA